MSEKRSEKNRCALTPPIPSLVNTDCPPAVPCAPVFVRPLLLHFSLEYYSQLILPMIMKKLDFYDLGQNIFHEQGKTSKSGSYFWRNIVLFLSQKNLPKRVHWALACFFMVMPKTCPRKYRSETCRKKSLKKKIDAPLPLPSPHL